MKMITILAGQQLQKDMAKRKLGTMSSIREDQEADAGETIKPFIYVILHHRCQDCYLGTLSSDDGDVKDDAQKE